MHRKNYSTASVSNNSTNDKNLALSAGCVKEKRGKDSVNIIESGILQRAINPVD
jgi:hypothetical protein